MNKFIFEQIKLLTNQHLPLMSVLANASAILNQMENINWCGFYIVDGDTLYLGPFQGQAACIFIPYGKGVCGTAFKEKKTLVVPDVNEFDGHIACSSISKSEIVTPIIKDGEVKAVIDIDSPIYDRFHDEDKLLLEEIAGILQKFF